GQRAGRRAGVGRADARGRHRRGDDPAVTSENAGSGLTHVDSAGHARMVDVSGKDVTARSACATGRVRLSAAAVAALRTGEVPKGDALAVARIAGIAGAKRTPDLIPLCHPIGLHGVTVDLAVTDDGVDITAVADGYDVVVTTGGTGLTPGDLTPEMTRRVIEREIPGIAEALRAAGAAAGVPSAILSRGAAGVAGRTLIVNLPGSTGGVRDG